MSSSPDRDGREPTEVPTQPDDGAYEPPTRAGYRAGTPFRYSALTLTLLSVVVSPVALVAFAWLATTTTGFETAFPFVVFEETTEGFTLALDTVSFGTVFIVALVGTVVLHELVHGLVFRLLGFDVSFGVAPRLGAFYTAIFEQFQTRRQLAIAVVAPLVVLTPIGVLLLLIPGPHVPFVWFGLVLNTGGAVGDLFVVWRLRQLPPGTLFYDVDAYTSYVYEPE
ncbi:DUF3267 domain-containing protein [Haloarchaeobius litoreus]|uniref:DUF3267 domain-containing protein n=1 Tax=Haloarchaeobius litoreus TaxID=755306 RepID=A0ABD6DIL0_9EURY|nr:DUF3267 domain-containing protein [Haloarchaeobius litoreus]